MRVKMFQIVATATVVLLSSASVRAGLSYENVGGVGLIYDSVTHTTWAQNADLSGPLSTYAAAQSWAKNLSITGFTDAHWRLASQDEFTSMFTQLEPFGAPGASVVPSPVNKYGTKVYFGTGANDYASNVEPFYWLGTNSVFNFFYGYSGNSQSPYNSPPYAGWAVVAYVPEPSQVTLALSGLVALGVLRLRRKVQAN